MSAPLATIAIGLGATLFMDLWALFLQQAFGVQRPDYCLVGRWFSHMPSGVFRHASIAKAAPKRFECAVGWTAHYAIGALYALAFVALAPDGWLAAPSPWPALAFGLATIAAPFLVMQPAFGFGIAAARTPHPTQARLRSLNAHLSFGLGLYASAMLLA